MNMFKVRYSYGKVGNDNVGTRFHIFIQLPITIKKMIRRNIMQVTTGPLMEVINLIMVYAIQNLLLMI